MNCLNNELNQFYNRKINVFHMADYFDNTGRNDILAGGVRMIPIKTHAGEFNVCMFCAALSSYPECNILW